MELKVYYLLPILAGCFAFPNFANHWFHRIERWFNSISASRIRAVALVAGVSLAASATLFLIRTPLPHISDEFAYLVGADTFAIGRLANPPHPLWQHFESIHIIQQPSYASKYPLGQSAALAVGQLLGHPIIGVALSTALACLAMHWMLLAYVPRRWALLGALMLALHPIVLTWSYSYWGGAIATAGGALVLGGFRRVTRDSRPASAFAMGAGMLILANSRPYEGFVLTLTVLLGLLAWGLGPKGPPLPVFLKRVGIPLVVSALLIGAELVGYNCAVTGKPTLMPYMVHESTYGAAPFFVLQDAKPLPEFRHKVLRDLAIWFRDTYTAQKSLPGFARASAEKFADLFRAFVWSGLMLVPLLALPAALRYDRWSRGALLAGAVLMIALLISTWTHPHYAAPGFGLLMLLTVQSLRQLRLWRWSGKACGRQLVRMVLALAAITVPLVISKLAFGPEPSWALSREQIQASLCGQAGKHLVIVRYADKHNPNREWVYNRADLDGSKVLWARAMSPEEDRELVAYFKDRKIWSLDADAEPALLTPFSP